MRSDLLLELADHLERTPRPFDMSAMIVRDCGTAVCVAGHAADLWPDTRGDWRPSEGVYCVVCSLLAQKLELTGTQRDRLFYVGDVGDNVWDDSDRTISYDDITLRGAIATVRRLAATGEVRWLLSEQTS